MIHARSSEHFRAFLTEYALVSVLDLDNSVRFSAANHQTPEETGAIDGSSYHKGKTQL